MSAPSLSRMQVFEKQLQKRTMELRKTIHPSLLNTDNKTNYEVAGRVLDIGEQSVVNLSADFHIIELEKDVAGLANVEADLGCVATGTYGECLRCGADIDVERLRVNHTAKRCIERQTRWERMAKDMTPSL